MSHAHIEDSQRQHKTEELIFTQIVSEFNQKIKASQYLIGYAPEESNPFIILRRMERYAGLPSQAINYSFVARYHLIGDAITHLCKIPQFADFYYSTYSGEPNTRKNSEEETKFKSLDELKKSQETLFMNDAVTRRGHFEDKTPCANDDSTVI